MTAAQRRAAAILAAIDEGGNAALAAQAAGVDTETLNGWMGREGFRQQVRRLVEGESDGARAAVWKALLDKCRDGDLAAIRLYFDLKDGKGGKAAAVLPTVKILDDIPGRE